MAGRGTAGLATPPRTTGVVELDPVVDRRWDEYVSAHPDGLVYHHSRWLRCLQREYGRRALGLAVVGPEGRVGGVLPLLETQGLPLRRARAISGRRLASLPRTPLAGPVADGREQLTELLRAAVERLRTRPGAQLQLKMAEPALDGLLDGLTGYPWRLSYVLELPDDAERVRFGNSRNHSRIRSGVNRAVRSGVRVREARSPAEVRAWYALYLNTMRHHIVPPRPLRLFEAMWEELRPHGLMRLLLAERQGELVAGSVLLMLGRTVFYAFNGALRSAFAHRPNDVLQWEAIHDAARAGHRRYDLGEVVEHHEGLADFRRKWSAQPRRLYRYYHPAPAHPPDPGDGGLGPARRAAHAAWRRVPLGVTSLAGDRLFRYL